MLAGVSRPTLSCDLREGSALTRVCFGDSILSRELIVGQDILQCPPLKISHGYPYGLRLGAGNTGVWVPSMLVDSP